MSIDFNGTTSQLQHTTATGYDVATRTVVGWCYPDGNGEGGLGCLFAISEAGDALALRYENATTTFRLGHGFSITSGVWNVSLPFTQWNAFAISYDNGNTANDPVARNNFAPLTVTRTTPPSGTATAPLSGYQIGNQGAAIRTWNGAIQHLQFFNVILNAQEMDAALLRPGSIQRGLVSWWPMWDASYTVDLVNHGYQPTATALASRVAAPCVPPWAGAFGWRGAFTGAAPPAATTVFRRTLSPVGTRTGARQVHGWA